MFADRELTCRDCGAEFTFSAGEQEFYQNKGFTNDPTRCPECRSQRKAKRNSFNSPTKRRLYKVVCADCGQETQVPFEPKGDRPVYCQKCFQNR